MYRQEAFRQLSDTAFYAKIDEDLTPGNQKLPPTAQNLVITTPRNSVIYFKPKIHKTNNPGRPIVSAYSCPTELISSYLDKIMAPIVQLNPYQRHQPRADNFSLFQLRQRKQAYFHCGYHIFIHFNPKQRT